MRALGRLVAGMLVHVAVVYGALVLFGLPRNGYGARDRPGIVLLSLPLAVAAGALGPVLVRAVTARARRAVGPATMLVAVIATIAWSFVQMWFTGAWPFGPEAPVAWLWIVAVSVELWVVHSLRAHASGRSDEVGTGTGT